MILSNSSLNWADNWLINLNIVKCKTVSYGRNVDNNYYYSIDNTELRNMKSVEDLDVTFDSRLMFSLHINEKINKAYGILGVI